MYKLNDDGTRSFDGVRIDKVINERNRQHVDNLKRRLVGREDEMIDVVRKRDFRGSKHDKTPAMDISSSKLTSLSRGNGKRIKGRKTCIHNNNDGTDSFASSHGGMEPLDYARNLQEGNRLPSTSYDPAVNNGNYTKTMAGYMDKIPQLGKGSMNTKRSKLAQAATKRQELSHPVNCITRCSNKALQVFPWQDENLDEIIKELETSTVLREVYLSNNQITLADGRFTAALASNTSLRTIRLHSNKIGDEGVQSLCAALKVNTTLTRINLGGCQISNVGANFLAEALMLNIRLENLNLTGNKIGDEGAQSLAMSLKVNNTLTSISLDTNQISTVGAKFFADALMVNTSLVTINLSSNNIGDEGARYLSLALKVNTTLTSTFLNKNQISEVGAQFLAEALMVNTVLQSMSLQSNNVGLNVNGNRIGEDGAQSLAKALKVNNTLVSINLCRCHISTVGAKFLAEALMINTKLEGMNLSANMIGDEGVQSLAEFLQ